LLQPAIQRVLHDSSSTIAAATNPGDERRHDVPRFPKLAGGKDTMIEIVAYDSASPSKPSMNFSLNTSSLLWGILFGSIGLGYFVYGKKQARRHPAGVRNWR